MTGSLVVQKEGKDMVLHFHEGQIARVEYENLTDENAFYEFLTWAQGNFRFQQVPDLPSEPPRIDMDTMGLLMEGMRRIDETIRKKNQGPSQ